MSDYTCDVPCRYGGLSAARKHSKSPLGHMWHCNRPVKAKGDRCYQHTTAPLSTERTDQ